MANIKKGLKIKARIVDIKLDYDKQMGLVSVEYLIEDQKVYKAYQLAKKDDIFNFEDLKSFIEKEARDILSLNKYLSEILKRKGLKFNIDV